MIYTPRCHLCRVSKVEDWRNQAAGKVQTEIGVRKRGRACVEWLWRRDKNGIFGLTRPYFTSLNFTFFFFFCFWPGTWSAQWQLIALSQFSTLGPNCIWAWSSWLICEMKRTWHMLHVHLVWPSARTWMCPLVQFHRADGCRGSGVQGFRRDPSSAYGHSRSPSVWALCLVHSERV